MNDTAASNDQKKDKKKREATVTQLGLAGAFGGAAYWALCLMRGGLPAGAVEIERATWLWASLGLCGFLGAFTAAVFVLMAPFNMTDRRVLGVAALAGVCWLPTLSGMMDTFLKQYSDTKASGLLDSEAATEPANAEQAASAATAILTLIPDVQNLKLKNDLSRRASSLVETIAEKPNSPAKVAALGEVGKAAVKAEQPHTVAQVAKALRPVTRVDAPLRREAEQTQKAILDSMALRRLQKPRQ